MRSFKWGAHFSASRIFLNRGHAAVTTGNVMRHLGKIFSTIKKLVRGHKRDTILLAKAEASLAVARVAVEHLAATYERMSKYRLALKVVTERIESLPTAGDAYADISAEIVRDLARLAVKAPRECMNQVEMIQEIVIALQVSEVI